MLHDSVGRRGRNLADDVKLIQQLLNFNLPLPPTALAENGVIDAATISAIEEYQRRIIGLGTPDGLVEPNGPTFKSLAADKFSFLPHRCQPLSGPSAAVDAAQMNPGFLTPTGVNPDPALQAIVKRRILDKFPELKKLRFALVDLTEPAKLTSPQYAGHRDTEQGGLGSMSKIQCMCAAYQLKADLEELARQRSITNQKDLFEAARDLWHSTQKPDPAHVTQLFPADPKIELQGKLVVVDGKPLPGLPGLSLPVLEHVFTPPGTTGGLALRFAGSDRILVDPAVPGPPPDETPEVRAYIARDGEALAEVRKLSFAEQLFLMIDDSDNAAAHSCIENVGFLYSTSVVWQSDFYSPARGGGLWESSTHDKGGSRWIMPPVPKSSPGSDYVSGNACSVAAIFTLIEQGRLVNRDASAGMKHLMDKRKSGVPGGSHTRSYFAEGLAGVTLDRIHSKLGIGNFLNDAAIIVRTATDSTDATKHKQIRYVAAGFDDPSPARAGVPAKFLNQLIVELDKCICENNGLNC